MSVLTEEETRAKQIPRACLSRKCNAISGYFREESLRIDLERQNKKLKKKNALYREAIDSLIGSIKDLLHPHYPAINLLREKLTNIPRVIKACYFVTDAVINLWIITEEEDFEAEMQIASALRELFSIFENLRFDFMIIPKYDMRLEEVIPEDSQMIFSKI